MHVSIVIEFDVDKGAQAIVLAEVAARIFVAGGPVFDFSNRLEPDERGARAIAPQAQGFCARANCAGFPAMFVNEDVGLLASSAKTAANEIHFGLHHSEIVLRAALENKPRT